ncbi:hypothetical protein B0H17DRAFT_1148316 [Mycena rosella]|uniref:Uncharacterized protein n=1 Tax=Mycena rosella TaxID=1033263 RepID=A0AAD7CD07_MYCRO|nr:hypothetical protein B0H17DRAFT_1148316 [Mycena rosella]
MKAASKKIIISLTTLNASTLHTILALNYITELTVDGFYSKRGRLPSIARQILRNTATLPDIRRLCIVGEENWIPSSSLMLKRLPRWVDRLTERERKLDWVNSWKDGLTELTLVNTLTPEADFTLPWGQLTRYSESGTIRIGRRIADTHLTRLVNVRLLCLAQVVLRANRSDRAVTMMRVEEFRYLVPPNLGVDVLRKLFDGINFPLLQAMHLKGTFNEDASMDPESLEELEQLGVATHTGLDNFLHRCSGIHTLEIGLDISFTIPVLLKHLESVPNLRHLIISTGHRNLLHPLLFDRLQDLTLAPCLRSLRITEPYGWAEEWAKPTDWNWDSVLQVGFRKLAEMAYIRYPAGFERLDFRRELDSLPPLGQTQRTMWREVSMWDLTHASHSERPGRLISDEKVVLQNCGCTPSRMDTIFLVPCPAMVQWWLSCLGIFHHRLSVDSTFLRRQTAVSDFPPPWHKRTLPVAQAHDQSYELFTILMQNLSSFPFHVSDERRLIVPAQAPASNGEKLLGVSHLYPQRSSTSSSSASTVTTAMQSRTKAARGSSESAPPSGRPPLSLFPFAHRIWDRSPSEDLKGILIHDKDGSLSVSTQARSISISDVQKADDTALAAKTDLNLPSNNVHIAPTAATERNQPPSYAQFPNFMLCVFNEYISDVQTANDSRPELNQPLHCTPLGYLGASPSNPATFSPPSMRQAPSRRVVPQTAGDLLGQYTRHYPSQWVSEFETYLATAHGDFALPRQSTGPQLEDHLNFAHQYHLFYELAIRFIPRYKPLKDVVAPVPAVGVMDE